MPGAFGLLLLLAFLNAGPTTVAAPLFDGTAPVEAELEGPVSFLMRDKENREELPFVFRSDGNEFGIQVRIRGKSRSRVCSFLPLRLNFRKSETESTLFVGQDKIKLVVPCRNNRSGQKDLLEEFAAYRIFNLLSPASYRVRLLQITYIDVDRRQPDAERRGYAFVIEPARQLAARVGGQVSELPGVSLNWLDSEHAALVYIFQYLIGNTDWSLVPSHGERTCCHNGTLIETDAKILYVPFDFDLAGLVDAPYAQPNPAIRIASVTERRYRGFCTDRELLRSALDRVTARRLEIAAVIDDLPVLNDKEKQWRIRYLEQFFKAAEKPDKLIRRFEKRCID